ncbi:unnamed protein product [Coffea canephora]|uniref:Uncharacterized protein n=1 Tax=Coffea canephora TaxID=49390 RepID=A0A068UUH2_COFCA|nr:unnamed protein product [Coffea canephora]
MDFWFQIACILPAKLDVLALEILSIALPVVLALLADPITSIVDTAFVGHLGSVELAAVGVSVSFHSDHGIVAAIKLVSLRK